MKFTVLILSFLSLLASLPIPLLPPGTNPPSPQLNTAPAAADTVTILTWQERLGNPFRFDSRQAIWHTDFGSYHTDAQEGCRNPGVPAVYEVC